MYRSTSRWTSVLAGAALIALPVAAAAQTPPSSQPAPTQQTPAQQTPTQQTPPTQTPQPTDAQQPTASQTPASGQVDAAAAKKHLSEARESLSQLTSLPEAAKLQGDARTQVSQLISNFNELITTQSNWRASYDKVNANLTALLGPDAGDAAAAGSSGAVGTSGAAGAAGVAGTSGSAGTAAAGAADASGAASVDPAIRAKLGEFRTHLKMFEQAAGGQSAGGAQTGDANAMPPAAATGSTSNPANPAASANPASTDPSSAGGPPTTAGATGTSGSSSPTANMSASDRTQAAAQVDHAEADKHLDAISAILDKSKTGTLTRTQTAELKKHVAELRRLLQSQQ